MPKFPYTIEETVSLIVNSYNQSLGIFANKVNAEDMVPKTVDKERALYLFWVIQMDYSTKSSRLYEKANVLYKESPTWIQARYIKRLSDKKLGNLINRLSPRYPNEIFIRFRLNSARLIEEYDGSAMNIITESNNANQLLDNIRKFRGFGPKLGSFLARTYIDLFKLSYPDVASILPPVDIHDVRLTFEWGFNSSQKMTAKNIHFVQKLWSNACKKVNVSWITFDKALWLIGSEGVRNSDPVKDFRENIGIT